MTDPEWAADSAVPRKSGCAARPPVRRQPPHLFRHARRTGRHLRQGIRSAAHRPPKSRCDKASRQREFLLRGPRHSAQTPKGAHQGARLRTRFACKSDRGAESMTCGFRIGNASCESDASGQPSPANLADHAQTSGAVALERPTSLSNVTRANPRIREVRRC